MIKNHRDSRIGAQTFAARARGEKDPRQINRHRAEGTDRVEAKFDVEFRAERLEALEVIQRARRGFG